MFLFFNNIRNEICIVFFGKLGSGKSFIGNIIFNNNVFFVVLIGLFIILNCFIRGVNFFERDIFVVDIFGLFDIGSFNDDVLKEVFKCIVLILFGLYCFFLVLFFLWFIDEDEKIIDYFGDFFGNDVYCYIIIVFMGKDKLDCEKMLFEKYFDIVL